MKPHIVTKRSIWSRGKVHTSPETLQEISPLVTSQEVQAPAGDNSETGYLITNTSKRPTFIERKKLNPAETCIMSDLTDSVLSLENAGLIKIERNVRKNVIMPKVQIISVYGILLRERVVEQAK